MNAATPEQAAYEVGDKVYVTGTVVGTNRRFDWVNIDAGGSVFSFGSVSTSPNISRVATQQPQPALGEQCSTCDGSGMLTVPDGDGESASEQPCPDPVHDADDWFEVGNADAGTPPQPAPELAEQVKHLVVTLRRISDQQEASGHPEGAYATGCAATMVEALIPPPGCGCTVCEATGSPHGVPQPAPGPAGCECGHAQTGHAFSDDVCAVPECPCSGYRSTPRAAPELAAAIDPDKLDLLADWFDADDIAKGRAGRTEVQEDLRRWATAVRDHRERAGLPS